MIRDHSGVAPVSVGCGAIVFGIVASVPVVSVGVVAWAIYMLFR